MTLKTLFAGACALALATPAFAEIVVKDPYARSSGPLAKAGAAFMMIENTGAEDDRLIAAKSDIAVRVELHTHKDMGEGVMRMMEVEEGFPVPAGGAHMLQRGGDHVMFMGLKGPMEQGQTVTVTLTFEKAGDMVVEIPVDLERQPKQGMGHGMGHGAGMGASN
ncbi:copper chaperone PCu(A)C [Mameliella sp. AT18]|uniref:copper chaperone PCu(A)C n=1 Tax=Mameliella TaxID=1434019 RepID=UPI0008410E46|nr:MULTISPECIES: copper chaperone PCu(A)C [Mameliella]MDD9729819.1 copper chaperone PCu(A)C [Mameliella sp. AT18]ODM47761.1 copper-binding protein [Ruegeria sp. PBVC088]